MSDLIENSIIIDNIIIKFIVSSDFLFISCYLINSNEIYEEILSLEYIKEYLSFKLKDKTFKSIQIFLQNLNPHMKI